MATLSRSRQLHRLAAAGQRIGELHRQKRAIERAIRTQTQKFVADGHELGLNNADLARMIDEVGPEAIRLVAVKIKSRNPRALGPRNPEPKPGDQS